MSKPTTMYIEANFDVDQVSPTLECKFNRRDADGKPIVGKNAGAVFFAQGEEVYLQVNGGGVQLIGSPKKPFKSFSVIDCTFTTRPRVFSCGPKEKKTIFSPPSPFLPEDGGATVVVPAGDFEAVSVEAPPGYYRLGQLWKDKLTVGQFKGRWRLTLMITVAIEYESGAPEMRVFEIDPESEVGSGTGGPGAEEREAPLAMAMADCDPESEVGSGTGGPG